ADALLALDREAQRDRIEVERRRRREIGGRLGRQRARGRAGRRRLREQRLGRGRAARGDDEEQGERGEASDHRAAYSTAAAQAWGRPGMERRRRVPRERSAP